MTVEVTRHAVKRLKERLGLKRKATLRYAKTAFTEGVHPKEYGFKPVSDIYAARQLLDKEYMFLIYRDLVHVFGLNIEKTPVLVTVYDPLSHEERDEIYIKGSLRKYE